MTPSCDYPPRLAADVEIADNSDPDKPFIAGSASVGRYLLLGHLERRVLDLLDGVHAPQQICAMVGVSGEELSRFLGKLETTGILAGMGGDHQPILAGGGHYWRFCLFRTDAFFGRVVGIARWIWSSGFLWASLAAMAVISLGTLLHWEELDRQAVASLTDQFWGVLAAAAVVTVIHEFAHGLTAKAFGGRATEIGFLLIYYTMPAFYCNVSGVHIIPRRSQRLWVIAAGLYSEMFLGFMALAVWLVFAADTLPGQIAMVFVLASFGDLVINTDPFLKLDGYFFLSQWLRVPNLMDRSRARWRDVVRRMLGWAPRETVQFGARDRRVLLLFGGLWMVHHVALLFVVVWFASGFLIDWAGSAGVLMTGFLMAAFAVGPSKTVWKFRFGKGDGQEVALASRKWRRYLPVAIALAILGFLLLPWRASVGSYGTLAAHPGRESILRAPEDASLLALGVQPGQQLAPGAMIARMGNLDLDEQISQVRTELARVGGEIERLSGELRVQHEAIATAEWELAQRRREFQDVDREQEQIRRRNAATLVTGSQQDPPPVRLPPALAALESETARLRAQLFEAERQRDRNTSLWKDGLVPRSELDATEARSAVLAAELASAQERLDAALIDHQRRYDGRRTEMNVAGTRLAASQQQSASWNLQLEAARSLKASLEEQLGVLDKKQARFSIGSPIKGTLFGEDLPRMLGKFFEKGAEICRVADISELQVLVRIAEQQLSDIEVGQDVRVKARSFPDRTFRGKVSRIGGEMEMTPEGQRYYRVELTIRNEEDLLRPGMTVFTRVDSNGRTPLVVVLARRLRQALRPELWML